MVTLGMKGPKKGILKKTRFSCRLGIKLCELETGDSGNYQRLMCFMMVGIVPISIIKQVLTAILTHGLSSVGFDEPIQKYLKVRTLQNKQQYFHILSQLPGPPTELSLEHLRPDLVVDWHKEKNYPLVPALFTIGSGQKIWWQCQEGHEWQALIAHRSRGSGCPYCAQVSKGETYKKLAVKRKGSLLKRNPELASEWHPSKNGNVTPKDRSCGSQEKIWWQCQEGHEWQASIVSRSRGSGCPYCAGRLPTEEYNLATKNPQLADQWHFKRKMV